MVSKFKAGDKVEIIYEGFWRGRRGVISAITHQIEVIYENGEKGAWSYDSSLKLIESVSNNSIMNIIEKIKLARKNEPEKTLVNAGLMDMDEKLTSDGQAVLNDLIIQDYKAKMKVVADQIIADEKEEAK